MSLVSIGRFETLRPLIMLLVGTQGLFYSARISTGGLSGFTVTQPFQSQSLPTTSSHTAQDTVGGAEIRCRSTKKWDNKYGLVYKSRGAC